MERLTIEQIEGIIERGVEEIAVNKHSLADAPAIAGRFLTRVAVLTDALRGLEEELPKHQTLENAQYNTAINNAVGKGITEKKVEAEANPVYRNQVEAKEIMEAKRTWVRNYIKIFENAHIMYRQYSRNEA
jgi:predicted MPP superfamily phosphohydrolase